MHTVLRRPPLKRVQTACRVSPRVTKTTAPVHRIARAVTVTDRLVRQEAGYEPSPTPINFLPDPHVDYGRFLTAEGGILIVYKDLDLRLRHILWAIFAWSIVTGLEGWFLLAHSPVHNIWINIGLLLIIAIINGFIVSKPVEIYRRIEIRPDCMILEAAEIFWIRFMEDGMPGFRNDDEGNRVLCGIYGTRFVEYLTVRRFDELDRMPEVFATHLQDAMMQLWTKPH